MNPIDRRPWEVFDSRRVVGTIPRPAPVTRANPRQLPPDAEALGQARAAANGMIDDSVSLNVEKYRRNREGHAAAMIRIADYQRAQAKRQRVKSALLDVLAFLAGGGIGYALAKFTGG